MSCQKKLIDYINHRKKDLILRKEKYFQVPVLKPKFTHLSEEICYCKNLENILPRILSARKQQAKTANHSSKAVNKT